MIQKPLLFLDVDGVINCPGGTAETYDLVEAQGMAACREGAYACVPHGTRERLAAVLPHFESVWATAWRGQAHGHFREHLDLSAESWPVLDWVDLKLPHILKYAGPRPWAWIDDDALWELRRLHDAFGELDNSLIVAPKPTVGLTDEHVSALLDFAARAISPHAEP